MDSLNHDNQADVIEAFNSTSMYLDFDTVNFSFFDGDVPRRASCGVYISQLIMFARVCNHVTDFNARNKCLTKPISQIAKPLF